MSPCAWASIAPAESATAAQRTLGSSARFCSMGRKRFTVSSLLITPASTDINAKASSIHVPAMMRPNVVMGTLAPILWGQLKPYQQRRLLVPKLVTGLKCFHLRPESDFFPKYNFKCVVETIPDGSDVVFMFGEIDCRDGIIRGVERAAYKDLEEGAMTFPPAFEALLCL